MNGFKAMRERARITQKALASRMRIAQSTVAMWESGENAPRAKKLQELARILGCTVDDFFKDYVEEDKEEAS